MNNFPENDNEFEEASISSVSVESGGWSIKRSDGWGFQVPTSSPIAPEVGMVARFYGKGIGHPVRGLFLDGEEIFYRTEDEQKIHQDIVSYGADATDWLARWDAGRSVFTIEMGGMGPGYEQAIQITVAENLRHMLEAKYDHNFWQDSEFWAKDRDAIEAAGFANPEIKKLGLSGAQWGAAVNLAARIYMRGPIAIMQDPAVKDRHIQVSKFFPGA